MHISYRTKIMLRKLLRVLLILLAVLLVAAIVLMIYLEPFFVYDRDGAHLDMDGKMTEVVTPNESANHLRQRHNGEQVYSGNGRLLYHDRHAAGSGSRI